MLLDQWVLLEPLLAVALVGVRVEELARALGHVGEVPVRLAARVVHALELVVRDLDQPYVVLLGEAELVQDAQVRLRRLHAAVGVIALEPEDDCRDGPGQALHVLGGVDQDLVVPEQQLRVHRALEHLLELVPVELADAVAVARAVARRAARAHRAHVVDERAVDVVLGGREQEAAVPKGVGLLRVDDRGGPPPIEVLRAAPAGDARLEQARRLLRLVEAVHEQPRLGQAVARLRVVEELPRPVDDLALVARSAGAHLGLAGAQLLRTAAAPLLERVAVALRHLVGLLVPQSRRALVLVLGRRRIRRRRRALHAALDDPLVRRRHLVRPRRILQGGLRLVHLRLLQLLLLGVRQLRTCRTVHGLLRLALRLLGRVLRRLQAGLQRCGGLPQCGGLLPLVVEVSRRLRRLRCPAGRRRRRHRLRRLAVRLIRCHCSLLVRCLCRVLLSCSGICRVLQCGLRRGHLILLQLALLLRRSRHLCCISRRLRSRITQCRIRIRIRRTLHVGCLLCFPLRRLLECGLCLLHLSLLQIALLNRIVRYPVRQRRNRSPRCP